MRKALALLILIAGLAYGAPPASKKLTVDSALNKQPPLTVFRSNTRTIRVTFEDDGVATDLTGATVQFSWAVNANSAGITTGTVATVSATGGVVDVTFTAANLNQKQGRYIYEALVTDSNGSIATFAQGKFTIKPSPAATGTNITPTLAVLNWDSIDTYQGTFPIFAGTSVVIVAATTGITINVELNSMATTQDVAALTTTQILQQATIDALITTQGVQQASISSLTTTQGVLRTDVNSLFTTQALQQVDLGSLFSTQGLQQAAISALVTTTATHTANIASLVTTTGQHTADIAALVTTTGTHTVNISSLILTQGLQQVSIDRVPYDFGGSDLVPTNAGPFQFLPFDVVSRNVNLRWMSTKMNSGEFGFTLATQFWTNDLDNFTVIGDFNATTTATSNNLEGITITNGYRGLIVGTNSTTSSTQFVFTVSGDYDL